MIKKYQVKVYNIDWTLKDTLDPKKILSNITFSSNINWWQWQLDLLLWYNYDYTWFKYGDFLKVYESDKNNTNILIYTWSITRITRTYDKNNSSIKVSAIWLFAFMSRIFFNQSWYTFSKNQDPSLTIENIVDYFNSVYSANRLNKTWIDTYGSDISLSFEYKKCNDAIINIQKATEDFYFFVNGDWSVDYKSKTQPITHKITLEDNVKSLRTTEDIETLANNVFVKYSWWVSTKSDATSQTEYWLKEVLISSNMDDVDSWDIYAQTHLDQNKDFKKETVLVINNKYNIELVKPWDIVSIKNTKYEMNWVQILKTQYSFDELICYLDKYTTLSNEIFTQ